jgi:hypothetical protein
MFGDAADIVCPAKTQTRMVIFRYQEKIIDKKCF